MLHFALTIGYVLFFLIHIVQVIRAGWNNFQAMITGFEVHKEPIEKATNTANL
jgi:thiosulfate reductase cytochrome b subunit